MFNMKCILLSFFFVVGFYANAQLAGCTDPLANNYSSDATINNGSCTYGSRSVSAVTSYELPEIIEETSGLIYWNDKIWTHNDDTDINLYSFDFENVSDYNAYELTGTYNIDQEEISQDSNYVYVGDFGNNVSGNRTNLKILRIEKQSLLAGSPVIDTIYFVYSNQTNFEASGANNTDFDCESFIVSTDSIYLFTKQWVSEKTTVYSLSKYPGEHIAHYKNEFDVSGLITGAVYDRARRYVVLCGYSSTVQPFFYLLYDFKGNDFFSGNKRKISFSKPLHQVEGITTKNGLIYYASNEKLVKVITIKPKIHKVDLSPYLSTYLNSMHLDSIAPVINSSHSDVVLYADYNCRAVMPDFRTDVVATDDATVTDNLIIVQSPHPGSYILGDSNQVSLRAYDEFDNYDEVLFYLNILDTVSPIITLNNPDVFIGTTENCEAFIPDFTDIVTMSDNCTAPENLVFTQTPLAGTLCSGIENEVLLSFTDESDNETQILINLSVIDTISPVMSCPDFEPILLDENELSYIVVGTEFDPDYYSDNCSISIISNDYNSTSTLSNAEFGIGTTAVVWTVADEAGNTTTCSYDVVIGSRDVVKENVFGLIIYPNPAKDNIVIKDEKQIIKKIIFSDINGKSIPITAKNESGNYDFDVSELSTGIYFINIETKDKKSLKHKVIKN